MKKRTITAAALLFALLLPLLSLPASAADYVKGTNGASDAYKASIYYDRLLAVPLTGDGRTDVLAVALSQLGYQEGDENGQFGGTTAGSNNFTEFNYNMGDFGEGYGTNNYHWCASFVAFCLLQARCHTQTRIADWCRSHKGDSTYIWREVGCLPWATQLRECGYFEKSAYKGGDYTPLPGDLIFFSSNGTSESHIGLVLYATDTHVYTVEGNTSSGTGLDVNGGGVYAKSYERTSSYITGYGVLPYAVNNDAPRIDYSGASVTPGLYVATKNKYVYRNEGDTDYTWVLPRYTSFTVSEVSTSTDRVRMTAVIGGESVTGYVMNNEDRVIQYVSTETPTGYPTLTKTWGYRGSALDYYRLNDAASRVPHDTSALTVGDTVGISGWLGFTRTLSAVGYYLDGDRGTLRFDGGALSDPEPAVTAAGGAKAKRYEIHAETVAGTHTVTFVAKLSDSTLTEIATVAYGAKNAVAAPSAPEIEDVTETTVTLKATAGYEYCVNGGSFQKSNVFTDLTPDTLYSFSQRVAETSLDYASSQSPSTAVRTAKLPETTTEETTSEVTIETSKEPSGPMIEVTAEATKAATDQVTEPDGSADKVTATVTEPSVSTVEPSDAASDEPSDVTDAEPTDPPETADAQSNGCSATLPLPLLPLALTPALLLLKKRDN